MTHRSVLLRTEDIQLQKSLFIKMKNEITVKPYSYGLVANEDDTAVHWQIISYEFDTCVS